MIHVLPSTLSDQKKYQYNWLGGDDVKNMPLGVLLGIQVTTIDSTDVKINSIVIEGKTLTIFLDCGGKICAQGTAYNDGDIVALDVVEPILSATIEIGFIPEENIVYKFNDLYIKRGSVFVCGSYTPKRNVLYITHNDIQTEYVLADDVNVCLDSNLSGEYKEYTEDEKILTIGVSEDIASDFTEIGENIIKEDTVLTTINGVPSKTGILNLTISVDGKKLKVKNIASNYWIEVTDECEDDTKVTLCSDFVDKLDSFISPKNSSSYRPLNDLYNSEGVRDSSLVLNKSYGGYTNCKPVSLFSVDTCIDDPTTE